MNGTCRKCGWDLEGATTGTFLCDECFDGRLVIDPDLAARDLEERSGYLRSFNCASHVCSELCS
jgi:hypothetical protein